MERILHIVSSLSLNSGVMAVIMNYYRYIDCSKIQFDFLYFIDLKNGTYENEIKALGGKMFLIERPGVSVKSMKSFNDFCRMRKGHYKIVHLHELYLGAVFAPILKFAGVKTLIGHAHANSFSQKKRNAVRNKILCIPVRYVCKYQFACSAKAAVNYFGKRVRKNKKYVLIHNAIDVKRFLYNPQMRVSYRKELGYMDEDFVIGNVGRLEAEKNQLFLLRVFAEVRKCDQHAKLLIVGEGKLKKRLADESRELGIADAVLFAGRREDIGNIYSAMDLFLFPSLSEGLGNVLIEAQCNGLKCIASDAIPEEASVLESYQSISLSDSPASWVSAVLNSRNIGRLENAVDVISAHGYDIEQEVRKLQDLYMSM